MEQENNKQDVEEVIVVEETISSERDPNTSSEKENKLSIPVAIIVVGVLIAGAILLSGKAPQSTTPTANNGGVVASGPAPVGKTDRTLGKANAKVTVIMYEDFQCPYCGAVTGLMPSTHPLMQALRQNDPNWTPFTPEILDNYVKKGDVLFVYRDFAFLGPESVRASEAARCAGDQGKFWEYHDYLYGHQNGENQGVFSDPNLKSFAVTLGLNATTFNQCLDSGKHSQDIADSKVEGTNAGVQGTPKGYILRNGKVVNTIEGAEPLSTVKPKIEAALR